MAGKAYLAFLLAVLASAIPVPDAKPMRLNELDVSPSELPALLTALARSAGVSNTKATWRRQHQRRATIVLRCCRCPSTPPISSFSRIGHAMVGITDQLTEPPIMSP